MDGSFLFLSEVNSDNEYDDDLLIEQIEEYSIKLKVAEEGALWATYKALHICSSHNDL